MKLRPNLYLRHDYVYHGKTEFRGIHTDSLLKLSPFQRQKFGKEEVSSLFPEYYILKVNGFNKVAKTPLEEWFRFLKDETIDVNTKQPGLIRAREIMRYDKMSKEEQKLYDKHLDNIVVLRDNRGGVSPHIFVGRRFMIIKQEDAFFLFADAVTT